MTFDAVPRWEERVEALDERRVPAEERRHTVDNAGRVDAAVAGSASISPVEQQAGAYFCVLKSFMMLRNWSYTAGIHPPSACVRCPG